MNTRDKILNHLETHSHASLAELRRIPNTNRDTVAITLKEMVEYGDVEFYIAKNRARRYRLTGYPKRFDPVVEYLEHHEKAFASDLAEHTGLDKQHMAKILKDMHEQGEIHREWNEGRKAWIYSRKRSVNWGCANPLTAFINQRLREVRADDSLSWRTNNA